MRHRMQALIIRYGVPAIWFMINPNDITDPVKLRLAAYRTRDPETAEEFLRHIGTAFKRVRLSISDPMSSAIFFHREIAMFFEYYVNVGEEPGRCALHLHGQLWLQGNTHLSSMLSGLGARNAAAYNDRIVQYVDSVFCEYVTNYATKVEDPVWKRVATAVELLPVVSGGGQLPRETHATGNGAAVGDTDTNNKTRRFPMRVRAITSQQICASRERVNMIQGIQGVSNTGGTNGSTEAQSAGGADVGTVRICLGPSTPFIAAGRRLAAQLTLNKKQAVAFLIICRQLDLMRQDEGRARHQLCQFVGGEGGTGKSRINSALVELFVEKGISSRLLITATSGTAAAGINGITIHSAYGFLKDMGAAANADKDLDGVRLPRQAGRFVHSQSRMNWQEKDVLVIDELCRLRGSQVDFGGISIVVFCGDFHQFRPVQERLIVLSSAAISWDVGNSFTAEQRHQHDRAHALWRRFTTVVMLDEQMRTAGDLELQGLLKRIRKGVQDQTDLDFLNSRCYQGGRRIPWDTGITVVTPLNSNRWNLNMEASLSFWKQQRSMMRIFMSEHRWKGCVPTEEETMILNNGDDSATPVPAIFMFVPGMPVVVNYNNHQGLKVVNGASYRAVEVILDKAYPGHRVSVEMMIRFGPPAGLLLAPRTTEDLHFVGMPAGTVLLTPMTIVIPCQRKRPWQQNDVGRKGLPCTAAFACTDYKVQWGTLERAALELRGTRKTSVGSQTVASQCDPYSLYVRERNFLGNWVPKEPEAVKCDNICVKVGNAGCSFYLLRVGQSAARMISL
ncbi:chitinase [Purpureocillium lavendulum]|uniref:ATP-dependent DNA helicase n=1 Tax=Purpureocillium lavendulum TaxID=1247861 RepID=A0AB34FE59_9HYPO|nr:chitinase [Purpureocillium lavendulum]